MREKRAEMTMPMIVGIIIALVLLVLVLFQVTSGFKAFDRFKDPFIGDSNVDDVARACEVACASNSNYDYCEKKQTLNFGKEKCLDEDGEKIENEDGTPCESTKKDTCNNLAGDLKITCDICA